MKLKDILTSKTWNQYGDMDVINDVVDEFHPAWCGQYCTEEGEKVFKEALELEAEIWNAGTQKYPEYRIMVHIDGPEGVWQKRRRIVSKLFSDMCGYCTCEEYDKWFIESEEEEVEPVKSKPKFDVVFSEEALNTVISALRLETERYWGKDEETVRLLKEAEEQVRNAIRR